MKKRNPPSRGTGADASFSGLSFLIVGLGSVGYRHLKNLGGLGIENIFLLRSGNGSRAWDSRFPFSVEIELSKALARRPAAVIISNPTACHLEVAQAAVAAGCHLFVEKPVSHSWTGVPELHKAVQKHSVVAATGFQYRFHPLLRTAKKWLDEGRLGRVVSCRAQYGEYLPSWHPGEDYRKGYSARAGLGGGPVLTLSHPFDYLRWLIGDVRSVSGVAEKLSHLEIDTEDTAHAVLRFRNGAIGAVELDYIQHPKKHDLHVVGEGGVLDLDFETGSLCLVPANGKDPLSAAPDPEFERNLMFVNEMKNFLAAIVGREMPVCPLEEGIRALEISLAVHRSSRERSEIDVGSPL